jgi:DNA-directed RNA polymerase specialized sigma24 family protein
MSRPIHDDVVLLLPRLRRYARVLTGNQRDADDLVVEAVRYAREEGRRPTLPRLMAISHALHRDAPAHRGRAVLARLQRSILRRPTDPLIERLDGLPLDERAALALVAVERFDYADVAEVLDVPVATAMETLARARARLRGASRETQRAP